MSREEIIGDCRLVLGDCRDILPTLGKVDAVVTDPPYGIGADKGAGKSSEKWTEFTGDQRWDAGAPPAELLNAILGAAPHTVMWGGNYFSLPPTPCWLIWDKETAGITTFADCEVAWTNLPRAMRLKRHLWSGPYMKVREERHHPTQKPLAIMEWCLDLLPAGANKILDPFMGSGTTGVACALKDRAFIGIERDERFFDIACRRIEAAYKQPRLFAEPETKPVQSKLFGDAA